MKGFYVYRYKDVLTQEIMYIGKTLQSTVKDRIDQHVTDPIGLWASTHQHIIEFIELPREEDMNYIESYLIRKHLPRYNTVLADATKTPLFEIVIKEELWKELNAYLKEEKEKTEFLKNLSAETISNNFLKLQQTEMNYVSLFEANFKKEITDKINLTDYRFILELHEKENSHEITISNNMLYKVYKIENRKTEAASILHRLFSYRFTMQSKNDNNVEENYAIFKKIVTNSNNSITFIFGENHQKLIEMLKTLDFSPFL